MTQLTGQFPNETYINGLRDNPESTLAVVYDEFRLPIIQSLTALGGQEETTAQLFQLAVFEAARLARSGQFPTELPFFDVLKALSIAHFHASNPPIGQDAAEAGDAPATNFPSGSIPKAEVLISTQQKFETWRQLQELNPDCQNILIGHSETSEPETEAGTTPDNRFSECQEQLARKLQPDADATPQLPDWAQAALHDREGYAIWQRSAQLELDWAAGPPAPPESNRIWRWAISILLLVVVGYGIYQIYFRPKTAAEVFADNFAPPTSLMDDMKARYGAEMANDSVTAQPSECMLLLREADAYYQANDYQAAMDPLLLIVLDSASICKSDAWYYLGIVHLQMEDPTTSIQCFAKIEDLGRFGEDLYWYQAMAFVQLAKENPMLRDKARRAVERTLGHTRDPQRRKRAETMLENLSK